MTARAVAAAALCASAALADTSTPSATDEGPAHPTDERVFRDTHYNALKRRDHWRRRTFRLAYDAARARLDVRDEEVPPLAGKVITPRPAESDWREVATARFVGRRVAATDGTVRFLLARAASSGRDLPERVTLDCRPGTLKALAPSAKPKSAYGEDDCDPGWTPRATRSTAVLDCDSDLGSAQFAAGPGVESIFESYDCPVYRAYRRLPAARR